MIFQRLALRCDVVQQQRFGLAIGERIAFQIIGVVIPIKAEFLPDALLLICAKRAQGIELFEEI